MILKINGETVDVTLENEKTVGDFLKSFEEEAASNDATTTSIVLDGKTVPADQIDSVLDQPLSDSTKMELTTVSQSAVIEELKRCSGEFDQLKATLEEVSVLLQSGKDSEASAVISNLAETVGNFVIATRYATLFPSLYEKILIDGKDIGTFFEEFTDILKDFETAMQDKDTVTVGDLSEYEISPRLTMISEAVGQL